MTNQEHKSRRLIPILYEDEISVVFDKPPGLVVFSDHKGVKSLDDIVNEQYFKSREPNKSQGVNQPPPYHLHPCHRLDKDTTGVILFAKGKKNQQLLMREFHLKRIKKRYIAFIHGRLKSLQGEIKGFIKDVYKNKYAKNSQGDWGITRYKVSEQKKKFCVVEVTPVTGRTNQIRIHFVQMGNPLVGEDKYAFRKDFELRFKRAALHSHFLEWVHPLIRKSVKVYSPLPKDMVEFLQNN